MKDNRFKYEYRANASKLHKKVGEILRTHDVFKNYTSYQEYPVNKINTNYQYNNHHFDWVILKLKIVIEVHGEQHYKPVNFGGISDEEAILTHQDIVYRDKLKKNAAEEAGYTYIEIPYNIGKKLTAEFLLKFFNQTTEQENEDNAKQLLDNSLQQTEKRIRNREARIAYLKSEKHQNALSESKKRRHEYYLRKKALIKTYNDK